MKESDQAKRFRFFPIIDGMDAEDARKRRLFILLTLPGVLFLLGFGIVNILTDNLPGGYLDALTACMLVASVIALYWIKRAAILYRLNAFSLFVVMAFWAIHGGLSGEKILWALSYPLIVLFMLGRIEGILWSASLLAGISFMFGLENELPIYIYPITYKIRFFSVYLVICILSYSYEISRQISQDKYLSEQIKLRREKLKLANATQSVNTANEALVKSEALLKHAQSIANMGSWEFDYSTRQMWCSDELFTIFGVARKGPGVDLAELEKVIPDFPGLQNRAAQSLRQYNYLDLHFSARHGSNGRTIYLQARAELGRDEEGHAAKLTGVLQDITARKEYEREKKDLQEKLARSQKMEALGLLAGGVAHDLNNVMLGIVSYPDYLLSKMKPDHELYKPLKNICEAGQKAAAIVEDLLTLARRSVTNTQVLNFNKIVEDYLESPEFIKLKSHHTGVDFFAELQNDLLHVKGSPLHLKKTIMNLVSNAAEAIADQGDVRIATVNCYIDKPIAGYSDVKEGDYILLSIEDTGSGIANKDLGHIFEPFYTKKIMGRSGTGLGMAVVWGAVQDHCGYIDVQSRQGHGTRIDVYLPITRETLPDQAEGLPMHNYMGRGEKLLIVDDVAEQRAIASKILTDLGYLVNTASSGEEAIAFVQKHQVDLLVLDMIMDPGMDGLDTYERILSIDPRQKAIIVSGFSETERVKRTQALGAGIYLKKPYVMTALGMAVRTELDR